MAMKNSMASFTWVLVSAVAFTSIWSQIGYTDVADSAHLDEDEAGLWMLVEKHEQKLRTSNRMIDDPVLTGHLKDLTCRTVGSACEGIRVYAIRAPGFNAFMMPNGSMFVQSGLLLRIEDDAELSAVLAHEVSHFERRHSIESLRRWRKTSSGLTVLSALIVAAGTVAAASSDSYEDAANAVEISNVAALMVEAAGIIAVFQLAAYDRDQEEQADLDSIEWMRQHNIDVTGAPRLWQKVIREQAAGGNHSGFSLLATHPAPEQRLMYLTKQSDSIRSAGKEARHGGSALYAGDRTKSLIDAYRQDWILDELAVQHPSQFSAIASTQAQMGLDPAFALYLTAKSWVAHTKKPRTRKRQRTYALQEADMALTAGDLIEGGMQAEAYREWGKISVELEDPAAAKERFQAYLEKAPDAWDAEFIRREIGKLQ